MDAEAQRRLVTRIALIVCLVAVVLITLAALTTHGHDTTCIDYPAGSPHKSRCITR
jgi:hypothetical protein